VTPNFITKPVELIINDKVVTFNAIDDFEFALDARTSVTFDKITETLKASQCEQDFESKSIGVAKEKLAKLRSQSPDTSTGINMRLKSINTIVFSKEHGWRDIFIALNNNNSFEVCQYKDIALKMYLQYLSCRQSLVSSVKNESKEINNTLVTREDGNEPIANNISTLNLGDTPVESYPDYICSKLGMTRLPAGKTVIIEFNEGDKIDILMSPYKCKLVAKDGIKFIDSNNVEYPLIIGKNKLGRDDGCTVNLNDNMKGISRFHLLIVNHGNKKLELTDVSTNGTYLLPQYILN